MIYDTISENEDSVSITILVPVRFTCKAISRDIRNRYSFKYALSTIRSYSNEYRFWMSQRRAFFGGNYRFHKKSISTAVKTPKKMLGKFFIPNIEVKNRVI
jgi:hypothetical protein